MPNEVSRSLSTERLGNLFELTVTGPDGAEQSRTAELMLKTMAWSTKPVPDRTVACTLTPDDAMDLRDEITTWLKSIGAES